jgi:hypothetical protein
MQQFFLFQTSESLLPDQFGTAKKCRIRDDKNVWLRGQQFEGNGTQTLQEKMLASAMLSVLY